MGRTYVKKKHEVLRKELIKKKDNVDRNYIQCQNLTGFNEESELRPSINSDRYFSKKVFGNLKCLHEYAMNNKECEHMASPILQKKLCSNMSCLEYIISHTGCHESVKDPLTLYKDHYNSYQFNSLNKYGDYFDRSTRLIHSTNRVSYVRNHNFTSEAAKVRRKELHAQLVSKDSIETVTSLLDGLQERELRDAEAALIYKSTDTSQLATRDVSPSDALCLSEAKIFLEKRKPPSHLKPPKEGDKLQSTDTSVKVKNVELLPRFLHGDANAAKLPKNCKIENCEEIHHNLYHITEASDPQLKQEHQQPTNRTNMQLHITNGTSQTYSENDYQVFKEPKILPEITSKEVFLFSNHKAPITYRTLYRPRYVDVSDRFAMYKNESGNRILKQLFGEDWKS